MTNAESKALKKGNRVYWQGDAADRGCITETSWDAVTIAWDNGQGGQSAPRRYARNPANAGKAGDRADLASIRIAPPPPHAAEVMQHAPHNRLNRACAPLNKTRRCAIYPASRIPFRSMNDLLSQSRRSRTSQ